MASIRKCRSTLRLIVVGGLGPQENLVELRKFGRTGLEISVLGFGCGAVGGLMVRGSSSEQERAVARALELGINFFDTAPEYGDGESERNIGRILKKLRSNAFIGTKVSLPNISLCCLAVAL